jgi:hypothetical protein
MERWLIWLLLLITICALGITWRVRTNPAFKQGKDEVVTREPGRRILGAPQPLMTEAPTDLEFAFLSAAAYEKVNDFGQTSQPTTSHSDQVLGEIGWERWKGFPSGSLQTEAVEKNLRAEVWSNASAKRVVVTFAGTEVKSWPDWFANLRWIIPRALRSDEYSLVAGKFGEAFVQEFQTRSNQAEYSYLKESTIYSTGHSLGAGLAQEFAYSLPASEKVPRVDRVFAFDPSPVTGFRSLKLANLGQNVECLKIDRVYERGEVLAYIRSVENLVYRPSTERPAIRMVRYDVLPTHNPILGHNMLEFAKALELAMVKAKGASAVLGNAQPKR